MAELTVKLQGMLFDMDGVLVSSIASAERCWRQWAQHYGLPNADTFTIPHGVRAADIVRMSKPDLDVAEGLKHIEDIEIADVAGIITLPGARELLMSLPAERWAIVTSATYPLVEARLKAARLPEPERLITAERVTKGKPDPEPYLRGAELVGVPSAECVVVEDAPSGVRAGKNAGCLVLGVLGTHNEEQLREAGADWVVRSLKDAKAQALESGLELRLKVLS